LRTNPQLRRRLATLVITVGALGTSGGLAASPGSATVHAAQAPAALGALLTYDYDNARSGDDPTTGVIATLGANPKWDRTLDQGVYAEPLIYDGRAYVATENDSIYALNARSGAVLWRVHVGRAVPRSVVNETPGVGCGDIDTEGITGTPVIDPANNELFAVAELQLPHRSGWRAIRHELLAISLTTHRLLWRRIVDPPGGNSAADYYIPGEQQRTALTLSGGRLYFGLGGLYGDCGQYHGFVVGLSESGSGALLSYQVPSQREGAIWETNGAVVAPNGNLFVATGNGSSNNPSQYDEGDSVIELNPLLQRVAVWAPSDWAKLSANDWDLGSAGPIQIPNSNSLFVAGKPANNADYGYLLNEGDLGGVGGPAYTGSLCSGGGDYGANAVDTIGHQVFVFAACGSGTTAAAISGGSFHVAWQQSSGDADGPPIVAGGTVFAINWSGTSIYGMNPATGVVTVYRHTDPTEHFATPAVGDAMLLIPTKSGVEAYRTIA
jgi:outer membrane protein assembly factor BamB